MSNARSEAEGKAASEVRSQWWIALANEPRGPYGVACLRMLADSGKISVATLACPIDGVGWKPLSSFPELHFVSNSSASATAEQRSLEKSSVVSASLTSIIVLYGKVVCPILVGISLVLDMYFSKPIGSDLISRMMNWQEWTYRILEIAFAFALCSSVSGLESGSRSDCKWTMICFGSHLSASILGILVFCLLLIASVLSASDGVDQSAFDAAEFLIAGTLAIVNFGCLIFEGFALRFLWSNRSAFNRVDALP